MEWMRQIRLLDCWKSNSKKRVKEWKYNNEFIFFLFFPFTDAAIFQVTFVDEDHFDDRVVRDVDLMGAHAVGATVGWPVIAIAKLFGRDVVDLRKRRRRRKCERDFIDERDYVISGRCDCGEDTGEMTRMI